jgi:hypothetical protein
MPEYTQHERAQLHAKARQQIRFISLAATQEATEHRRFLATGYLLALREAEVLTADGYAALMAELQDAAFARYDALYQQNQPPKPSGVHCTGHVDYDPASRTPGDAP